MTQTFRDIDKLLEMRPKGVFRVSTFMGRPVIVINRPGEPEETIICLNMADANKRRKAFLSLRENRLCKWPGCPERATHVDHIVPHKGNPVLRDDPTNWQGLCAHHHNSAKQRLERRIYKGKPS